MKIFITGSSGFIGFSVAKHLMNAGHNVHGFDNHNKYYDVNLKKSRKKILAKYKNFSFTREILEKIEDRIKHVFNYNTEEREIDLEAILESDED